MKYRKIVQKEGEILEIDEGLREDGEQVFTYVPMNQANRHYQAIEKDLEKQGNEIKDLKNNLWNL